MKLFKSRFVINLGGDRSYHLTGSPDIIKEKLHSSEEAAKKEIEKLYDAAFLLGITGLVKTSVSEMEIE